MKVLVTGSSGFVGKHLLHELKNQGHTSIALDRHSSTIQCDITNASQVQKAVSEAKPDWVIHLAGQSSIPNSIKDPETTRNINVGGTENLLRACKNLKPKILIISSAHVYGVPEHVPLTESSPLNGKDPYSLSRIEQEAVTKKLAAELDLQVVIARSFNHTGPGQNDQFVVPAFAKQIVAIERGTQQDISVGNLKSKRDFSDVRDIVKAYILALEKASPDTYNISSGTSYSIQHILDTLVKMSTSAIRIETDPARYRESDIPDLHGDHSKFTSATGWEPQVPIEQTLQDVLDYWRGQSF